MLLRERGGGGDVDGYHFGFHVMNRGQCIWFSRLISRYFYVLSSPRALCILINDPTAYSKALLPNDKGRKGCGGRDVVERKGETRSCDQQYT